MMGSKLLLNCLILTFTSFSLVACGKKEGSTGRTVHRNGKPTPYSPGAKERLEKAKQEALEKAKADKAEREARESALTQTDSTRTNDEGVISSNEDELVGSHVTKNNGSDTTAAPSADKDATDTKTSASSNKTASADSKTSSNQSDDDTALAKAEEKAATEKIDTKKKATDLVSLAPEKASDASADDKSTAKTDRKASEKKSCDDLTAQLESIGWEKHEIEVPENHSDAKSAKIHVAYYKQKGSKLENPMLFMENYFTKVRKSRLESFTKIAKTYQVDPILMDPRGWGCSSALPDQKNISQWQHYGGRGNALDAEMIRKKELGTKKWKVWGHQLAGYAALRLVELAPEGISSLHLTDFTPMRDVARLMTFRIEAQDEAWKEFLQYAADEKGLLISDSDLATARKTLKEKWACSKDKSKICEEKAFDVFAYLLRSTSEWDEAVEALDALMKGDLDKKNILKNTALFIERVHYYYMPFRLIDFDQDRTQTACPRALEWASKKEGLKNAAVNSCRIEVALGQQGLGFYQQSLKFDPYNHDKIKQNLKKYGIEYHWMIADRSLFYPVKAAEEHFKEYKDYLVNKDLNHSSKDVQIYEDPEFLQSLKPKSAANESTGKEDDSGEAPENAAEADKDTNSQPADQDAGKASEAPAKGDNGVETSTTADSAKAATGATEQKASSNKTATKAEEKKSSLFENPFKW